MEIKSSGWNATICKVTHASQWLIPVPLTDPLGAVDCAIKAAEEKLNESGDITNVRTEVHMSLEEYRYMIKEALLKGQYDAWDLARRIAALGEDCYIDVELCQAFGACNQTIIFNLPPDEAIEKDKAYQKKKEELHVGDEVEFINSAGTIRGYVTNIISTTFVRVLTKEYGTYTLQPEKCKCKKTGNTNAALIEALRAFDE